MKTFTTEFQALDAMTKEMKTWQGPNIPGKSWEQAQQWCYENAGYLLVNGELIDSSTEEEE